MIPGVCLQFLACLAQLPPPMNITDILWLSCFSCPLLRYTHAAHTSNIARNTTVLFCCALQNFILMVCFCYIDSVSLLGKPPDSTVMTVATGKNLDAIPRKVGLSQEAKSSCMLLYISYLLSLHSKKAGFILEAVNISPAV